MTERTDVRLSLPSKGRLAEDAEDFLAACGLSIHKPNPRQYAATIPGAARLDRALPAAHGHRGERARRQRRLRHHRPGRHPRIRRRRMARSWCCTRRWVLAAAVWPWRSRGAWDDVTTVADLADHVAGWDTPAARGDPVPESRRRLSLKHGDRARSRWFTRRARSRSRPPSATRTVSSIWSRPGRRCGQPAADAG